MSAWTSVMVSTAPSVERTGWTPVHCPLPCDCDCTDPTVVNVTIYVNDYKNNLAGLNAVYPAIFPDGLPARTAIGVAALPLDAAAEFQLVSF